MKTKLTLFLLSLLNISIAIAQNDTIFLESSLKSLITQRRSDFRFKIGERDKSFISLKHSQTNTSYSISGWDTSKKSYLSIQFKKGNEKGFLINYETKQAYKYEEGDKKVYLLETAFENVLPNDKDLLQHDHPHKSYQFKEDQLLPVGNNLTDGAHLLQSRPGASTTILLDFDGEDISGWGYNFPEVYASNYTDDQIRKVWEVITADFLMFDVNITTDSNVFNSYATEDKLKCVFGTCTGLNKVGGLSLVNIFGTASGSLVNSNNSSNDIISVAHIGSHEIGHGLGLMHDGTMWPGPSVPYYEGHADWAPIMGTSYYKKYVTWSKGEYEFASQAQDDLQIIAGHLGNATDDKTSIESLVIGKGDSLNRADNYGVIENPNDVDTFQFELTEFGPVKLNIGTSVEHTNLDVEVELLDSNGASLTSKNILLNRTCEIDTNLNAGVYFLLVKAGSENGPNDGFTKYSSFGYYDINGTIPSSKKPSYDLSIAEVKGFEAICGESIIGDVTIKNLGDSAINGGELSILVDGILIESIPFSRILVSSESYDITGVTVNVKGAHNLKFEVNPTNGIVEDIESNNSIQIHYTLNEGTHVELKTNLLSYDSEAPFTWQIMSNSGVIVNGFNIELENSINDVTQEFCLTDDCYDFVMTGDFNLCSAYSDYQSGVTYVAGDKVNYNGAIYESKWWNSNVPTSSAWFKVKDCNEGNYFVELKNKEVDTLLLDIQNQPSDAEFCLLNVLTSTGSITDINEIKLFPNPTTQILNISFDEIINELRLLNLSGAEILKTQPNQKDIKLDLVHFPPGVYFVQINNSFIGEKIILTK